MKIVIPGGAGHVGAILVRHLTKAGHEVVLLSRNTGAMSNVRVVAWDGTTLGAWCGEIDGADVVINLAGRTVNCRYTTENLNQMMQSRTQSARVVGEAIRSAKNPPKVWLQASTATIYAHRLDAPNDEFTGVIGGSEPGAPFKWDASIKIAKAWEEETMLAVTPGTRKVLMRSAMTMSPDHGSVFDVFSRLAEKGLGGTLGTGEQYVSWIHEDDFARSVSFLIEKEDLEGPVNLCSPNPLPQKEFARILREELKVRFGFPAPAFLVELGTWAMRTESELVLKSRRVIPGVLMLNQFEFEFPEWRHAARNLVRRRKHHIP